MASLVEFGVWKGLLLRSSLSTEMCILGEETSFSLGLHVA
jgi:hypothetical protein